MKYGSILLLATVLCVPFSGTLFAADPGTVKWAFKTEDTVGSSPALGADGTVFIGAGGGVYALDGETGEEIWKFEHSIGMTSVPALGVDGTVYVGAGSPHFYALDGKTGQELWSFETGAWVRSSPAIGPDGTVYFGSLDDYVYAVDGETGEELWSFETEDPVLSSPAIGVDGTVYIGSYDHRVYALDGKTGEERWSFETGARILSSPAIGADGTVYNGSWDAHVYAIDGETGEELWSFETGGPVLSSPTIGMDGTVYFGSYDHRIYALDGETGEERWSFETGDLNIYSSPAIGTDGTVYIGSWDNYVYALDGETGDERWSFRTGGAVEASPALGADGTVYIASQDDYVYALEGDEPLAESPWPKFRKDLRNTGSIQELPTAEERIARFYEIEIEDEVPVGSRMTSPWLGSFAFTSSFDVDACEGWLFHDQHGWLYWTGTGWFWRHSQQRWTYMTDGEYPFVYVHERGWFYFYEESPAFPDRQWFSSYREEEGELVPDSWVRWFHHAEGDTTAFRLDESDLEPGVELLLIVDAEKEGDEALDYTLVFGEDNQVSIPAFDEEGTYVYEMIDAQNSRFALVLAPVADPVMILENELLLNFESANEGRYELILGDEENGNDREEGWFLLR